MTFPITFLINASGLFDFDLTLPTEALLFLILAAVVTFLFLSPISKQMDERSEFINTTLSNSRIFLIVAYDGLTTSVELLTDEVNEMNRQIKLIKEYTNTNFEEEICFIQDEHSVILDQLQADLAVQSAYLVSNMAEDLTSLVDTFFVEEFQINDSIS
jgi:preprotein translocase subunit YajC